ITDYRSKNIGLFERSKTRPIQHQEFLNSDATRKRYWARSFLAWPYISSAAPNYNHYKLSFLQNKGYLKHIITQNVDFLHCKAGSSNVTELHGCLNRIKCLSCGVKRCRFEFQLELSYLNSNWLYKSTEMQVAPDGDVNVEDINFKDFKVPNCRNCNGILQPGVVFFGDNVSSDVVNETVNVLEKSDSVLVLGSSLQVC
ncbi:hypothetical protein HELRODRAFT_66736, partial [Helobdella robusta]|uniref:Deacetylase sirtuin-type domain-containing protein n=1 Tax=Helobdella robusta TaxID=6412 RepID=T1FYQ0_HELRO